MGYHEGITRPGELEKLKSKNVRWKLVYQSGKVFYQQYLFDLHYICVYNYIWNF